MLTEKGQFFIFFFKVSVIHHFIKLKKKKAFLEIIITMLTHTHSRGHVYSSGLEGI